jgi:hypothetical protein
MRMVMVVTSQDSESHGMAPSVRKLQHPAEGLEEISF